MREIFTLSYKLSMNTGININRRETIVYNIYYVILVLSIYFLFVYNLNVIIKEFD